MHWEDPVEEGVATHSSILAQRIPGTEEPGGLQSMEVTKELDTEATQHTHRQGFYPRLSGWAQTLSLSQLSW